MATLPADEESQLLQTIEMFEVITQSQPNDYESLDILKEAYVKLAREKDVIRTSKRIAEAYVQLGQLSSAILEYESVLQRFPDDQDVLKALAEIESKANSLAAPAPATEPPPSKQKPSEVIAGEVDDGRAAMQKLFVDGRHVSLDDFNLVWKTPSLSESPKQPTEPLIQAFADRQIFPLDRSLKLLLDKSRLGYLPLDKYDVDIEWARSFPRETCLRWCILPFDRMSKSIFVATSNPFNVQAVRELERLDKVSREKYRLLWYIASPADLLKILKKIFR